MYDRFFKHKIFDDVWTFFLITEEEATELDQKLNDIEDGFDGITVIEDKHVYIAEESLNLDTIGHELTHVYAAYFHVENSNLNKDQYEEVFATFLGKNVDKFIKKRNLLMRKYKKFV